MLIDENRWRAQRYGVDDGLVDFGKGEIVPYPELMEELLELVAEDAEALKCESEISRARTIIAEGTSAHRQVKVYDDMLAAGGNEEEALKAVVDLLVEETTRDI